MKLIPQAKNVTLYSYSMWANYLGILCLVAPEIIFWLTERDTNPRFWWVTGIVLIIFGIAGRLIDQSNDRYTLRSHIAVAFLAVALPLVAQWEGKENRAYLDRIASPPASSITVKQTFRFHPDCEGLDVSHMDGLQPLGNPIQREPYSYMPYRGCRET